MATITDLFCGAGGSSTGAANAGATVRLALNHWKIAIETHNRNHPEADHDCTDISNVHPLRYSPTDILIASPECTNHSPAKGKAAVQVQMDLFNKGIVDPSAVRSRATMWDVPRFAEYHKYKAIVVENVFEVTQWAMYPAWIQAMSLLGYEHKVLSLNSMFFGNCPQSRDRVYIVFTRKGMKKPDLEFRPAANCDCCGDVNAVQTFIKNRRVGKYRRQYHYHCPNCGNKVSPLFTPASAIIDFSNPGKRIGDRKTPLSPNTMRRIVFGIDKYYEISEPNCLVGKMEHSVNNAGIWKGDSPLATMTTRHTQFVLQPPAPGIQFVGYYNGKAAATLPSEPINTITTVERHFMVSKNPDDWYFRMFLMNELKGGMAFDTEYILTGTGKEKCRQLGNAVTPPVMEWIIKQLMNII